MRLDDLRESSNVEDRRGFGGRGMMIGGGGLGLVVLIVALLLGVDPRQLRGPGAERPVAQHGQAPDRSNPDLVLSSKVLATTEDVWGKLFEENGGQYRPATFTVYEGGTQTACGLGQAAMGPFYCPADQRVYLDLAFFRELSERFSAPGDFAKAYVIAHEIGHHVQNLTGISRKAEAAMQRAGGGRGAEGVQVRLELQADCFAGVWARRADQQFHMLEGGDMEEGLKAAYAVGDDTLQRATRGSVAPDSFTHGTSAQRMDWFKKGAASGNPDDCDTFAAGRL
jgi:predicted metalloprotease